MTMIHPQWDPVALHLGPIQAHWYGLMYLLVIASSSFIYVALADIFPLLHKQGDGFIRQSLWIATGVAVVPAVGWLTH